MFIINLFHIKSHFIILSCCSQRRWPSACAPAWSWPGWWTHQARSHPRSWYWCPHYDVPEMLKKKHVKTPQITQIIPNQKHKILPNQNHKFVKTTKNLTIKQPLARIVLNVDSSVNMARALSSWVKFYWSRAKQRRFFFMASKNK